jgi:hypothetical protein
LFLSHYIASPGRVIRCPITHRYLRLFPLLLLPVCSVILICWRAGLRSLIALLTSSTQTRTTGRGRACQAQRYPPKPPLTNHGGIYSRDFCDEEVGLPVSPPLPLTALIPTTPSAAMSALHHAHKVVFGSFCLSHVLIRL